MPEGSVGGQSFEQAACTGSQVAAYIRLGLLRRAYDVAAGSGSRTNVRLIAAEAGRRADADVVALCTAYLSGNA